MIFILEHKCYSLDDHVFEEGDMQDKFVNDVELNEGIMVHQIQKKET